MQRNLAKISKLLSLVLRHDPGAIGIGLDAQGWVDVDVLLAAIADSGKGSVSREMLDGIVATNDKKRFAFSEDGKRIRASQGHSVEIELGLEATVPPEVLFHGTATRFLAAIFEQGLVPGSRQHVHLSADEVTAHKVGSRHGKPVILTVDCASMLAEGAEFFLSANGVWLTASVSPEFLKVDSGNAVE